MLLQTSQFFSGMARASKKALLASPMSRIFGWAELGEVRASLSEDVLWLFICHHLKPPIGDNLRCGCCSGSIHSNKKA
jgi:hypothetical protein